MYRFYYHSTLRILCQLSSYTQFQLLHPLSIVTPIYSSLRYRLDRINHESTMQHVELLKYNEIQTPLSLSDPPLPPTNHIDPSIFLPEPEDKLNIPPLSPKHSSLSSIPD